MTRRRIAVVSSCAPPLPGHPVTGGGLRTAQLLATLAAGKHSVLPIIERAALPDDAPEALRRFAFGPGELGEVIARAAPSVLVVEQWALVEQLGAIDLPLALDLHGSLLLENVYRRGRLDLVLDAKSKLHALHRADLLLAPAAAQLHHFAAWATLAGFDPRELPLSLLPLAPPAAPAAARATKMPPLTMVYGGARWPWIDSQEALITVAGLLPDLPGATVQIATFDPPRHGLPFEEDLGTWPALLDALRDRPGVSVHDGLGHDAYAGILARSTVALDLWSPNPERMLAATTRTMEFLAAGLPVITVAGAAWAEELVATGAGWTVPAGDGDALRSLLRSLHAEPARIAAASASATRLATERAQLDRSGAALLDFASRPTRALRSQPLVEAIVAVRQTHLDETLRSREAAHADEHRRLVAEHRQETGALREAHAAEVAELRARAQAELDESRRERRAEIERVAAAHRAEVGAMVQDQRAALDALDARGRAEREQVCQDADQRLIEANEAAQAVLAAQVEAHRADTERIVAAHRKESQAAAEVAQERWRVDRARDKEERVRIDVERRAEGERRLEEQRKEHRGQAAALQQHIDGLEATLAGLRAELASYRERKAVRLADALRRGGLPTQPLPGRVGPAAELARLLLGHALDRERD